MYKYTIYHTSNGNNRPESIGRQGVSSRVGVEHEAGIMASLIGTYVE